MKALVINCSPVRTGATAEIVKIVSGELSERYDVKSICIDDYAFAFCKGCRSCHNTAKCVMKDAPVIREIMNEFDEADIIVTNPPFSLFREFIAWIFEANKHCLIIGNIKL